MAEPSTSSSLFPQTRWTLVHLLNSPDSRTADIALEQLCRAYHRPLYVYARGLGLSRPDAEDLVQSLFARLLAQESFKTLQQQKGRMRSWIVRVFLNEMSHWKQRQLAQKRGGNNGLITLDFSEAERLLTDVALTQSDPARACDLAQAIELWRELLPHLREKYRLRDRQELFTALEPALLGGWPADGPGQKIIAEQIGTTALRLKAHLVRLREQARLHFSDLAREKLDPAISEEEVAHLWGLLTR